MSKTIEEFAQEIITESYNKVLVTAADANNLDHQKLVELLKGCTAFQGYVKRETDTLREYLKKEIIARFERTLMDKVVSELDKPVTTHWELVRTSNNLDKE